MPKNHRIVLLPMGKVVEVAEGTNLRTAARTAGVEIDSVCAENGTCGKCKILVETGNFSQFEIDSDELRVSPVGPEETAYFRSREAQFASRGWHAGQVRLSCQAKVRGDVVITIPDESRANKPIVRKSSVEREIELKPSVRKYLVEMRPPTLQEAKADWERLASGLATSIGLVRNGEPNLPSSSQLTIDPACLNSLASVLRRESWRVTATVLADREVIRVQSGYDDTLYGASVDVGTTTIALELCDLQTGAVIASAADANPQAEFGADIMTRIQHASMHADGTDQLHKAVIRALNRLLLEACTQAKVSLEDVVELAIAGNTTMQHLVLGLSPVNLGTAPFTPTVVNGVNLKARDLRLAINKSANVYVLPAIAGFIGGDTSAVIIAEAPNTRDEQALIIDIGTNAELVLGSRKQLICASTPTGPAFEGAHIEHGMRAAPGAIEHLRIDAGTLRPHWKIIGEDQWDQGRPKGLCGTAVIDAIAELHKVGALNDKGQLILQADTESRIRRDAAGSAYLIASAAESATGGEITVTQKDIRQIQLAKGALRVAADTLLQQYKLAVPDVLILAGAFGTYLDPANALAIGMLPEVPVETIRFVGNSAGTGARMALLNRDKRIDAERVSRRISRYELPTDPDFQKRFMKALEFPPVAQ